MRHMQQMQHKCRPISFAKATGAITTLALATLASNSFAFTMSSPVNGVQLYDPMITNQAYNPIPGALLGRGYDSDTESLSLDCLVVGNIITTVEPPAPTTPTGPIPTGGGGCTA